MRLYLYILISIVALTHISCTRWLDVKPEDKFTEDQIYTTKAGIAEVMNGLYIKMATPQLYGRDLTLDKLDLFAQRYYGITPDYSFYEYINRNYENIAVKNTLASIWDNMYLMIGNANQFLSNLDKLAINVLTESERNQYKGEAIAIRSLAYFDLLKMYGPVFKLDSTAVSIPYYRVLGRDIGDFLPANEVIENIVRDLDTAINYLKNDPIVSQAGTLNYNSYRINLYAAKLLKAKVLLWRGDNQGALMVAKEVIAQAAKFPWVTHEAATGSSATADRIFSTEVLFGIFNNGLYDTYDEIFSSAITERSIIATGPSNYVSTVFENNSGDYRYEYSWIFGSEGVPFRTFIKYRNLISQETFTRRYTIPVMRLSEAYYIAAETETNPQLALSYLNTVRQKRNLPLNIEDPALLRAELTKEYEKEFYGEGQLWYYYKRNAVTTVRTPNTVNGTIAIATGSYVFPIPDSETGSR
ncbi:RagB/SusD family nutrient uptake outer membrane protein [Niabella hibiscisoli]|uniref:RagB/SusD family nutrient uptake outer membrane protein n=1 Tax=Niabella hibiscisoli TaxID=1825928 RepID=UPI001F0E2A3A|nr:RagB/SusD family nutrient uptake outer membrane protein [Niabella hibiscisoli]MCH5719795.1 RagB/SusD family nutrient uptake outer membrane protein [Niabella hibiscisoli]